MIHCAWPATARPRQRRGFRVKICQGDAGRSDEGDEVIRHSRWMRSESIEAMLNLILRLVKLCVVSRCVANDDGRWKCYCRLTPGGVAHIANLG